MKIPFNKPYVTGKEMTYIQQVIDNNSFAGNGPFSRRCVQWVEETTGCQKAILVPSGTAALEMMMILAQIGPGDEVIMPSFTFSSTANAVVLRGATPVFIDIRPDTLNMDENLIEAAVTSRTKAILPVHYAGVGCEMDTIMRIAGKHHLLVLEDAAQGILSYYKQKHLGTLGQMGALSFHETKNIHCGEGGALLINDPAYIERAEIIMEKGTDRSKFFRGEVAKYTWVDLGSSYLINEMTAAFLWAQLEEAENIIERRLELWNKYHDSLAPLEVEGFFRRPVIPEACIRHNGHIYYAIFRNNTARNTSLDFLKRNGIQAVFHYVPLHSSHSGIEHCKSQPAFLPISDKISTQLLRLPLYIGVAVEEIARELSKCKNHLNN